MSNERETTGHEPTRKPNPRATDRGYSRAYTGRSRSRFSYKDIPAEEIGLFVQRATTAGLAVIFGVTSDGGALSVTILDGDERIREWPSSVGDWEALHAWLNARYGTV